MATGIGQAIAVRFGQEGAHVAINYRKGLEEARQTEALIAQAQAGGKTMLVQQWLQRLHREGWFGVRRVYAWSFYSQGTKEDRQASEDSFLAHALDWFGVQCEPTLSPWDKGRLLADAVVQDLLA